MNSQEIGKEFIEHFGVKGMRWGVRRTPEELGRRQEKREKKAQKFERRASTYKSQIDTLRNNPASSRYQRNMQQDQIQTLEKKYNRSLKDAKASREGKMTSGQKKVALAITLTAAYVTYKTIQSGEGRRKIEKGKEFVTGNKFEFKKNAEYANSALSASDIQEKVVKGINPEYGAIGTKMNCRRATFAYEMRRRGHDVVATRTTNASGQNVVGLINATTPDEKIKRTGKLSVITRAYKEQISKSDNKPVTALLEAPAGGANKITSVVSAPHAIFETLAQQPNGSRGELTVGWAMGGGHSMAYEVVNGVPTIFDGQTGKMYDSATKLGSDMVIKSAGFTRLDNVDLNPDFLMRWLRNA